MGMKEANRVLFAMAEDRGSPHAWMVCLGGRYRLQGVPGTPEFAEVNAALSAATEYLNGMTCKLDPVPSNPNMGRCKRWYDASGKLLLATEI